MLRYLRVVLVTVLSCMTYFDAPNFDLPNFIIIKSLELCLFNGEFLFNVWKYGDGLFSIQVLLFIFFILSDFVIIFR